MVVKPTILDEKFMSRKVVDPVWLMEEYPTENLDATTAINNHKELAQECMFNNMNGFLTAKFVLDMKTKKKVTSCSKFNYNYFLYKFLGKIFRQY